MRAWGPTIRFFSELGRDVLGTARSRWRRWQASRVDGRTVLAVGVDIFPFFEKMTGVGWYEFNLLEAIDRLDGPLEIELNLYAQTFLAPTEPAPPPMPGTRRCRLRLHHLPEDFALPIGPTISLLRLTIEPLLRFLDGNDVYFAPNFFPPASQRPFGRTLVATVHDLAFARLPWTVAKETLDDLRRNIGAVLYHADRMVAVSEATAIDLEECFSVGRDRVHVIHSAIDPAFSEPGGEAPELPERYLLFLSTLEPRKNVLGVIAAWELLRARGHELALVLVGRWGWRTEAIEKAIDCSPWREEIHHLDYVPAESLSRIYAGAEALLFPSWLEGFGFPILEAMICGTPVVTSDRSAMAEVAGDAAVLVDPGRPESIADGTEGLLKDARVRAQIIEAGRCRAASFAWSASARATASALATAAGLPVDADAEHRV